MNTRRILTSVSATLFWVVLATALPGCNRDEDTKRKLAEEQEARKQAEQRYEEIKREKRESNHIHRIEKREAERKIGTLTVLSMSAVLALVIVILLLARERWLRRIVHAALLWVVGKEGSRGP